jgi:hypothetical protein
MPAEIRASFREARREERKKILEAECEELQLLKVSVFPLSGELSMSNHIQRVPALTPLDHRARAVFCQWFIVKCLVNT